MRRIGIALSSILAAIGLLAGAASAHGAPQEAGTARFAKAAEADFDQYTANPTPAQQQWMRNHYWRMRTYAPYFDSRLSWYSDAWSYKDLYAIYRGSSLAQQHPEWILKDSNGNKLYIPWGCGGGTCPQYAADVGNPAFRQYWINQASQQLDAGYRGLFVDDVNMEFRVGNGQGTEIAPRDPRTGQTMSLSAWRRYVAEFTEDIRAAFPDKEIVHNSIWYSGHSNQYVARELKAADYIDFERGVNDPGITSGGGKWGYETYLAHIDWLHSHGVGAILDSYAETARDREYNLASYFLISSGNDGLGTNAGGTPGDWWAGYNAELGAPKGARYSWNGVLRRDFDNGVVLVNQPGDATRTLNLGGTLESVTGQQLSSVTLAGGQGVVLSGSTGGDQEPVATTSTVKRTVHLRGRVRDARTGRVLMRLSRQSSSGRFNFLSRRRAPVRGGRYSRRVRLARGNYRVRIMYRGPSRARVATSASNFSVR